MSAPAHIATLYVPDGWRTYLEGTGCPEGSLPTRMACSPQDDHLQIRWPHSAPFHYHHLAMLIAVGFGSTPDGRGWVAETLEQAFVQLPAYRRAVVEQPHVPEPAVEAIAPVDPDEARRRRSDAAYDATVDAMRSLHLFEDKMLRATQANPNLSWIVPMSHVEMAGDKLARVGRLLLGEIQP